MTKKIFHRIMFLLAVSYVSTALAQEIPNKSWDIEKIKGTRNLPNPSYDGFPFLTDSWVLGKIELKDGIVIDSLNLRFNSFKDELIYYNKSNASQIVIDKLSLKGFEFNDTDGQIRVFREQYYDNFGKGERFFEVLTDGETDLLAYRKVNLNTSSIYKDNKGMLKNMVYEREYQFYFYSPEKGYTSVRMNLAALLSKFAKPDQKQVKKLLRKYRIRVSGEDSFVQAWKVIEKEGYHVSF
jgi:hypothetical protein